MKTFKFFADNSAPMKFFGKFLHTNTVKAGNHRNFLSVYEGKDVDNFVGVRYKNLKPYGLKFLRLSDIISSNEIFVMKFSWFYNSTINADIRYADIRY